MFNNDDITNIGSEKVTIMITWLKHPWTYGIELFCILWHSMFLYIRPLQPVSAMYCHYDWSAVLEGQELWLGPNYFNFFSFLIGIVMVVDETKWGDEDFRRE